MNCRSKYGKQSRIAEASGRTEKAARAGAERGEDMPLLPAQGVSSRELQVPRG